MVKRWKKIFQANGPKKKASVAILIADKINVKPKLIRRYREGHYMLLKEKFYKRTFSFLTSMHKRKATQVHKGNSTIS